MLEDELETFTRNVYNFLIGDAHNVKGLLLKKHSVNLKTQGDYSFPNTLKSWHEYIKIEDLENSAESNLLKYINKSIEDIIKASQSWCISIARMMQIRDRLHVFLERPKAIGAGLTTAIRNNKLIAQRLVQNNKNIGIDPLCDDHDSVSYLRLKYLTKVIQNLCSVCDEYEVSANNIVVSSKSSSKSNGTYVVLSGTVLNAKTGNKESSITAADFIRMRQKELTLIAQHKYGVRAATESKWKEFIAHLGESSAAFELLQTKPGSAVKIQFDSAGGSSKGAAFILYNCARLETIIRTYNEKVIEGSYPALPNIDDVDLTSLTQEDEWCLIFNFVLGLPSLLANCVENGEFRPHHICSYLSTMVKVISQYYRRTRILTEPRKHLLPVMFARLHMLTVINDTLKTCLSILNIKSVTQM